MDPDRPLILQRRGFAARRFHRVVRLFHVNCGLYWQGASMPTPDEYRKIAETYYRLAREAKTEADRLALLDLAKSWLEAASREGAKSVRERRRNWHARAAHLTRRGGRWSLRDKRVSS